MVVQLVLHANEHRGAVVTADPTAVIEQYLAVVADLDASPDDLAAFVHPDARFTERPNLIAPGGRRRDAACARAAFVHSRALLSETRLDVHEHVVAGDRVVTRATWTGVLAIDAGPVPAGTEMRAECCMVFTVRDGQIHEQDNYDCYHPVEVAAAVA
jgi:ketosteroid isomerase-like protein